MIETPEDFANATEYERLVLDRFFPLFPDEGGGGTLDLRQAMQEEGPAIIGMTSVIKVFSDGGDSLRMLAPMAFASAWKVLDLLVELALAQGGFQPHRRDKGWAISCKVKLAKQAPGDKLLGIDSTAWSSVCDAYASTAEHRHCLTHRRASFTEQPLRLTGKDRWDKALQPLEDKEIRAFVHLAQLLGRGVLEGKMAERTIGQLRFLLQQMSQHTGYQLPGGVPLGPIVSVFMCLQPDEEKGWLADFDYVHQKMARTMPDYLADVWIDIPNESGYRLFGQLEQLPKENVAIQLDSLPSYLTVY